MTPSRRSLFRLLRVCLVLLAVGYGAWWLYDYAFKPGEVRRRVHEALMAKFEGVDVEIGSAYMRPFLGGVNITELKLIRQDDPSRTPFLHVPKATIWFDKSLALNKLPLGKIELDESHIRIIRQADGKWNVDGLLTKTDSSDGPSPVLVLKKARLTIQDQVQGITSELDIRNTDVTVVNDPATVYTVEAKGQADPFGKFAINGRYDAKYGATGQLDLTDATLGASLSKIVSIFKPEAAQSIAGMDGLLGVNAKLDWKLNEPIAKGIDIRVNLKNTTYRNPDVPTAITDMQAKFRFYQGDLDAELISGKFGNAPFKINFLLNLRDTLSRKPGEPELDILGTFNDRLMKANVTVQDLAINEDLFRILPTTCEEIQVDYQPNGLADISFEQRRDGERVIRKASFKPKGMSATYEGFPYPISNIDGFLDFTFNVGEPTRVRLELNGEGKGKPVRLTGNVIPGKNKEVDLEIVGTGIVLDKTLIEALPGTIPEFVNSLRSTASGDFRAKIRHNAKIRELHGPSVFDNEFNIQIKQGTLNYEEFPYPLKNLAGQLYIRTVPDHATGQAQGPGMPTVASDSEVGFVAFKNFTATGPGGAKIKISGSKAPEVGGMLLSIDANVEEMELSGDLKKAITKLGMDKTWNNFDISGRMNSNIEVRIHDRCPPGNKEPCPFIPARDLELGLTFNGASICPKFFPYAITGLVGRVRFKQSRVEIEEISGKHGPVNISLQSAEVRLPESGGFWSDLRDLKISPVVPDREFLTALPKGLRKAWEGIELKGPVAVHLKQLVVDDCPNAPRKQRPTPNTAQLAQHEEPIIARGSMPSVVKPVEPTTVYWNGTVTFQNASFNTGITWDKATGQIGTWGLLTGDRLGPVVANVAVDQAVLLKQPIKTFSARLEVDPRQPDIMRVPWLKGNIYGGEIAGQAQVVFGPTVLFNLALNGTKMRLEEIAKVNQFGPKTQLSGLATATLKLSNPIDQKTGVPTLNGDGVFDIPNGKLLDLPVVLDVIKLARLRPMDQTMFEEVHANFHIRGNRVRFSQLDLIGNAFSLGGEGDMNLDASNAAFEFYTVWTNIREFLGTTGEIPARLSSNLYKIKVTGNLSEEKPTVSQVPLPIVMDPVRRLMERVRGR